MLFVSVIFVVSHQEHLFTDELHGFSHIKTLRYKNKVTKLTIMKMVARKLPTFIYFTALITTIHSETVEGIDLRNIHKYPMKYNYYYESWKA